MRFILTIISILSFQFLFAQAPHAIGFQGVAYGPDSEPLREQNIQVKTEVLESSASGLVVYAENHNITTNSNGLYDLKIGRGSVENGDFTSLNWAGSSMFLRVSLSMDGAEFYEAGTTEFLSVPYALVAGSAEPSQKIFVTHNPHVDFQDIKFYNDYDHASFKYVYHWIHGNPEEPIFLSSNVDTIRGGILKPDTDLIKCDPSTTITPGTYELLYKFKIGERVMETLPVTMQVDPILYGDCLSEFPLTLNLDTNTCDPDKLQVESQITISEGTPQEANMTNPFTGADVELEASWFYCRFNNPTIELPDDEFPNNDIQFNFNVDEEIATFNISYYNEQNEDEYCELVYKK